MPKGIIYKYTCKETKKSYIGQTIYPEARQKQHLADAMAFKERNFCRAMVEYGANNFTYVVLEECDVAHLNARESFWITQFDSIECGYNMKRVYSSKYAIDLPPSEKVKKDCKVPKMPEHLKHLPPAKPFSDSDLLKIYAGTYKVHN